MMSRVAAGVTLQDRVAVLHHGDVVGRPGEQVVDSPPAGPSTKPRARERRLAVAGLRSIEIPLFPPQTFGGIGAIVPSMDAYGITRGTKKRLSGERTPLSAARGYGCRQLSD